MKRHIARAILRVIGWRAEGSKPASRKYVIIAAPHTSAWDFPLYLLFAWYYEVPTSWMGKEELFRPPFGWFMYWVGGIPIRRHRRMNRVEEMARHFSERESLALLVPAEGTRRYVPHWKSGFYRIAEAAQVPIVMGFLDFGGKRGGMGPELIPTGDLRADMDEVRAFYADKSGRHPELFGEVRLKEEG